MRKPSDVLASFFVLCAISSVPLGARTPSCLDTTTTQEFATYVDDTLRTDQLKLLQSCFESLEADSDQLEFFHTLTEADDRSRFDPGHTPIPDCSRQHTE